MNSVQINKGSTSLGIEGLVQLNSQCGFKSSPFNSLQKHEMQNLVMAVVRKLDQSWAKCSQCSMWLKALATWSNELLSDCLFIDWVYQYASYAWFICSWSLPKVESIIVLAMPFQWQVWNRMLIYRCPFLEEFFLTQFLRLHLWHYLHCLCPSYNLYFVQLWSFLL